MSLIGPNYVETSVKFSNVLRNKLLETSHLGDARMAQQEVLTIASYITETNLLPQSQR